MGGHGHVHIHGNHNNIKEDDAKLGEKIRNIELIKHNPQVFHLDFYDINNHYEIAGGVKTLAFALAGGFITLQYFLNVRKSQPYNFYVNIH